jgi:amino-acid N-acetyltransferase
MSNQVTFRQAQDADWPVMAGLLSGTGLQLVGAREHLRQFLVVLDEDGLFGCAGLELYGDTALLRSVAVAEPERGKGHGQMLVEKLLLKAQQDGVKTVIVLAHETEGFFRKFDFEEVRFDRLPAAIQDSMEFKFAKPDSTTAMLLNLAVIHAPKQRALSPAQSMITP